MTTDNTPAMPVTSEWLDELEPWGVKSIPYRVTVLSDELGRFIAVARAALALNANYLSFRAGTIDWFEFIQDDKRLHDVLDEALQGTPAVQADQDQAGDKGGDGE